MLRLDIGEPEALIAKILERARGLARPCVVALDGRSGAGKSTLAARVSGALGASVIDSDEFFAGGVVVRSDTAEDRARDCIDWKRQRPILEALRAERATSYLAFDWDAFDGRLRDAPTLVEPHAIVLFEGVYTGRPELRDLVDLRILVRVSDETRLARLRERDGALGAWARQWHEAEEWYFTHTAPPHGFDASVEGSPNAD